MEDNCSILKIDKLNLEDKMKHHDDAVTLYTVIFAEEPYNEHFEFEEVKEEFKTYIEDGCFLVAIIKNEVVGFICSSNGYNKECEERLINETKKVNIDIKNDIYISELGVDKNYRGLKIGKKLLEKLLDIYKNKNMFLRTTLDNNKFVIDFYKKYGFVDSSIREEVTSKRCCGCDNEKDERIYMVKYKEEVNDNYEADGYKSGAEEYHALNDKTSFDNGYYSGCEEYYDTNNNKDYEDDGYKSGAEDYYDNG